MKKLLLTALAPVLALVPGMASAGEAESCDVARQSFELKQADETNPATLALQSAVFAAADDQQRRTEQNRQDQVKYERPRNDTSTNAPNLKIPDRRVEAVEEGLTINDKTGRVETTRENSNIKIKYARPESTEQITHSKGPDIEARRVETSRETANIKIKSPTVETSNATSNGKIKYARPEVSDQVANEKGTRRIETQRPTLQHKADD